jgi:glycerol-3-phosphate dehydrogenase (NAD(P)+)
MDSVAVVGAGAWGTALAQAAAMAGRSVRLYGRDPAVVNEINTRRTNGAYLGAIALSDRIEAAADHAGIAEMDFVILAVPAQASRATLISVGAAVLAGKPVVLSAKGFEAGTLLRQSEILKALAPARALPRMSRRAGRRR